MDAGFPIDAGLNGYIGLVIDEIGTDRVRGHLEVGPQHLQPFGLVHGGVYAVIGETLASVGASIAAHSRDPGHGCVGLENHTSFLRAAGSGTVIQAEAVSRHGGRRVQHWTVTMRDGAGRELALTTVRLLVVSAEAM